MRGLKRRLRLQSRHVLHSENGFRTVSVSETLSKVEKLLLSNRLEIQWERIRQPDNPFYNASLLFLSPEGNDKNKIYFGKGLTEHQSLASAAMEFIERYCSSALSDDAIIEASFHEVKKNARDPIQFILPEDSSYSPESKIDWIWGYSMTCEKPVLVPANLVFCPYVTDKKEKVISWYDSNGLASGNCIEEAILHGLLEVVERDAVYIMEYNRLVMPDMLLDLPHSEPIVNLLKDLRDCNIQYFVKNVTSDIPIPTFGVFLQGTYDNKPSYSYAVGSHLSPRIALSRALTEAAQLYPRCKNYEEWLSSGPLEHYYKKAEQETNFNIIPDLSFNDLKANIKLCISILKRFKAEVIVVDLSIPEMMFPVARVLVTNLQPQSDQLNQRLSKRLFKVPVNMKYRKSKIKIEDLTIRALCGYGSSLS